MTYYMSSNDTREKIIKKVTNTFLYILIFLLLNEIARLFFSVNKREVLYNNKCYKQEYKKQFVRVSLIFFINKCSLVGKHI